MASTYKVTTSTVDKDSKVMDLQFEFKSRKVAIDVRDQLIVKGFPATAELTKKID